MEVFVLSCISICEKSRGERERGHLQTLIEHGPLSTIYLVSIDSNTLSFIYFTYNQTGPPETGVKNQRRDHT